MPEISTQSSPYLMLVFGILALLVVNLIIALLEGVFLTWLGWNPFKVSMMASFIMNIISGIFTGILLVLLQGSPRTWLPISLMISIVVEVLILSYFKRDTIRKNIVFVFLVNLASYAILILPAFYFGTRQ
jgi:LytS/YehU family sensor histidine kinase